jgi:hypothetical protein
MELCRNTHHVFRISARKFFKLYPDVKKKYFWGGKLWTQSFFIETVGNVNDEVIREYVRNQLKKMVTIQLNFKSNKLLKNREKFYYDTKVNMIKDSICKLP